MLKWPVDFFGREILVGDVIVYPGRSGSSQWMNGAVVAGFDSYKPRWSRSEKEYFKLYCIRWNPVTKKFDGRRVTVFNIHNVVVVK